MANYATIIPNPVLHQLDVKCSLLSLVSETSWQNYGQIQGSQKAMGQQTSLDESLSESPCHEYEKTSHFTRKSADRANVLQVSLLHKSPIYSRDQPAIPERCFSHTVEVKRSKQKQRGLLRPGLGTPLCFILLTKESYISLVYFDFPVR